MTDERPSLDSLRIHREPEDARAPRRWPWVVAAVVLALAIGFLGGLFPAVRAARVPVATALREG